MKTYKQWEIPNGSKVKLWNGEIITFNGMDGVYARWTNAKGKLMRGNFKEFVKEGDYFMVL